jgi:tetratricopeptide (TPR) repeat protein
MSALSLLLAATLSITPTDSVPLYNNLGDHEYVISTSTPLAQRYFNQGLRLYYAFNHAEAIRAFREAQRLDSGCAMCFWGEALAWGPNINLPMDSASHAAAFAAVTKARQAIGPYTTTTERALIQALSARYDIARNDARAALDSAYSNAMRDLNGRFPNDPEVAVLYAESEMTLRPWSYWTPKRTLQPGVARALKQLEKVMSKNNRHPGACHFFIHAVEAVQPKRAVECAERLASLMPGAGHLVHMPGHIYIRVGRYADAIAANEHAVHADESYIRDQRPGMGMYTMGYYPHNYDFLAFAAAMLGNKTQSLAASDKLRELTSIEMMSVPGMGFLQHHGTRSLQMRVRFGAWTEILNAPAPDTAHAHARAMWHYAHGRALAATGRVDGAAQDLASLRRIMERPALRDMRLEFNTSYTVLRVAEQVLAGTIASARGEHKDAVAFLTNAVEFEDELNYGEPPEWSVPARQDLGAVLMAANRHVEAARVFRADLERFPKNAASVAGLEQALRAQGRVAEADHVKKTGDHGRIKAK